MKHRFTDIYLKDKNCFISLGESLHVIEQLSEPQYSCISETFSKFNITAICVRRENLSRIDQEVALLKYVTKVLTSLSKTKPPILKRRDIKLTIKIIHLLIKLYLPC